MAATREDWAAELATMAGIDLQHSVPLAPRTSFRIGGPAELFVSAQTPQAAAGVWRLARQKGVPLTVLGGGTNVLVADAGVGGIVLELGTGFTFLRETPATDGGATWEVGAACGTGKLVRRALERGLAGPEVLAGVPGWLGGALIMNAGGREGELGAIVSRVQIVDQGEIRWLPAGAVGFAYRHSAFPAGSIVLGAELVLSPGDREALRATVKAAQARRRATQPLRLPSAGSIFKNPQGDHAGRLIEAAGCKGWRQGAAEVSELHANFIVNRGSAAAADVVELIRRVRRRVAEAASVRLDLEIKLLGELSVEES